MLTKTLAVIGLIIILLSLCALLFFPVPSRSFARELMQGGNLVDTSVQPTLVDEAALIVAELVEAAGAASSQAELDAVIAEATAQAGLLNTAATASGQTTLRTALEAASEDIASQDPTVTPTNTPIPTGTSTPMPPTPTHTPTPVVPPPVTEEPPDSLPVTGGVLAQVVPTVIVEADYPTQTEINHSDFIRVTLVQISEGVYVPTVEVETEREIITVTPKPIPNSTPHVPIRSAFGDGYKSFAVARLSYGKAIFDVGEPIPRERQSLDKSEITWKWNLTPKESGEHIVNLVVEVEWEPLDENAQKREPHVIWDPDLKINVADPPIIVRGQINALGLLGTILGSALNVPFIYKVIQDMRERRSKTKK